MGDCELPLPLRHLRKTLGRFVQNIKRDKITHPKTTASEAPPMRRPRSATSFDVFSRAGQRCRSMYHVSRKLG